jgi:hypothetical protein
MSLVATLVKLLSKGKHLLYQLGKNITSSIRYCYKPIFGPKFEFDALSSVPLKIRPRPSWVRLVSPQSIYRVVVDKSLLMHFVDLVDAYHGFMSWP